QVARRFGLLVDVRRQLKPVPIHDYLRIARIGCIRDVNVDASRIDADVRTAERYSVPRPEIRIGPRVVMTAAGSEVGRRKKRRMQAIGARSVIKVDEVGIVRAKILEAG